MTTAQRHRLGGAGPLVAAGGAVTVGLCVLGLGVLGLGVLGGCGPGRSAGSVPTSSSSLAAPTTTTLPSASSTVPPSTVAPVTTVSRPAVSRPAVSRPPSAPQPSPAAASAALILDWEGGRRSAAGTVATATAVATLFRTPYAGQVLNDRGCSDAFRIVCSWGPYAGASSVDALYEIAVAADGASWYVSAVVVEG